METLVSQAARGRTALQAALQSQLAPVHTYSLIDALDPGRFGLARILAQASHDLFGTKDVQDVATASYVWLADQLGHLTLGLAPTLALCWAWQTLADRLALPAPAAFLGHAVSAAVLFGFWIYKEREDIRVSRDNAGKVFLFDSGDIEWNVKTALVYFGIGGALAMTAFTAPLLLLVVVPLASWPGLVVAVWWLRRKLAFQQTGCPFLYRLANFRGSFQGQGRWAKQAVEAVANLADRKILFWQVLLGRAHGKARSASIGHPHLLVTGPFRSGKTSLAVGIATEFAFTLGTARYVAPDALIEAVLTAAAATAPTDFDDGRVLWRLQGCELVVVDNVDSAVALPRGGGHATVARLVRPDAFVRALEGAANTSRPLAWLADRRSVWVVGDVGSAAAWQAAIAEVIGIPSDRILVVELAAP